MAKIHTGADVKSQFKPLSEADLQAYCDEASFQNGYDYYLHHAIVEPTLSESVLRAFCHGSGLSPYRVEATLLPTAENSAHKLASAGCSCPRGGFCKHLVALLLVWVHQPERFVVRSRLMGRLSAKSREELLALLEQLVQRQPDIEPMVELLIELPLAIPAQEQNRPGRGKERTVDSSTIESQVASAFYYCTREKRKVRRTMAKKSKSSKHKKGLTTNSSAVDRYFDLIGHQIFQGNYAEAVINCERLLNYLPKNAPQRVDVLDQLGTAQAMLQNFPQSYAAYSEALSLDPNDAALWLNRGMASRFTSRFGRSLRDYERAKELNTRPELAKKLEEELKFARELAEQTLKLRGPDFTLDQLIEQEGLFQDGLQLAEAGEWEEAEQVFQASIAMGDCLPQPWGNLGICLMMQERYDEAEAALKRALVIDPRYTLAKSNLAALPEIRRTGPPARIDITDPFKSSKLKQSITFLKE